MKRFVLDVKKLSENSEFQQALLDAFAGFLEQLGPVPVADSLDLRVSFGDIVPEETEDTGLHDDVVSGPDIMFSFDIGDFVSEGEET